MQNEVNQRIRKVLESKNLKPSDLAIKMNVTRQYVAQLLNRKTEIGSKPLKKFLEIFPDVNPGWLMNGHGTMYTSYQMNDEGIQVSESCTAYEPNPKTMYNVSKLEKELHQKNAMIDLLLEKVERLESEISALRNKYETKKKEA